MRIIDRSATLGALLALSLLGCSPAGGGENDATGPSDVAGDVSPDAAVDASAPDTGAADVTVIDTQETTDAPKDASGDTVAPKEGPNGQACPLDKRVGRFEIAHWEFYGAVAGQVTTGVIPLEILQAKEVSGDCRLMRKENPFCDPPCAAGQLCTHGGACSDYPANQSAGVISVDGLLVPVAMDASITNAYAFTDVPFPMFEPNEAITLVAQGAEVAGFTLRGYGVEDLKVDATTLTLEKGNDLTVTWTASEGHGKIHMRLNVDQHGNSPVTMVCDVNDTGEAVLPGELLSILLEYGVSGFATFDMYRQTVDSIWQGENCIQLRTHSFAPGKVLVEGHVPCFVDQDCPEGEVCKVIINTCVGE